MKQINPFKLAKGIRQIAWYIFFFAIFIWLLSSCEQKELCYDHNHASNVVVKFNWEDLPAANPSSMLLHLIPREATELWQTREFIGKDGGEAKALVGIAYRALAYNSNTKNTLYLTNEANQNIEATTKDAATLARLDFSTNSLPKAEGTEEERTVLEADSLYSATSEKDIYVSLEDNDRGVTYNLELTPRQMFCTYKIRIKNIDNIDNVSSSIAASLSGLAEGIDLSTGESTKEKVIVTFPLNITADKTLEGQLRCYGKSTTDGAQNKLVIYTVLLDGTKWCYKYDVTKQVEEAKDYQNVEIVLDTLPIPKEIKGNSGLTPGVSDWTVVDVPINM